MDSSEDWKEDGEPRVEELRALLGKPNSRGLLAINERVVECCAYLDAKFRTDLNISLSDKGKWIGPSCEDCDDYECSESQFVSCEMGTYFVESFLTQHGKEIGFSEILDAIEQSLSK